jgi:hypothetical protein
MKPGWRRSVRHAQCAGVDALARSSGREPMARHEGGCQCGAVRYAVEVELDNLITCNCSRCGKLGSVLAFAPASAFELQQGHDA